MSIALHALAGVYLPCQREKTTKGLPMTDKNLASLPTLDLLGMLYSAQANYANAKSDREREIVQKQKDEILEALTTIRNIIDQNIEQFS